MSVNIANAKKRSEWVELQFMARISALGLTAAKPWGDSSRYDFIVDCDGRLIRVQVKSTTHRQRRGRGYQCHTISCGPWPRGPWRRQVRHYTSKEVDFLALYVIPEDVWFIIPVTELRHSRLSVLLNPGNPKTRYFQFLEAWHLFGAPGVFSRSLPFDADAS
jgi:hypothetical protein